MALLTHFLSWINSGLLGLKVAGRGALAVSGGLL